MIECFFSILTRQALTQSVQRSKKDLKEFLLRYLKKYSENPKPFTWTKGPDKLQRIIEATKQYQAAHPKQPKQRKGQGYYQCCGIRARKAGLFTGCTGGNSAHAGVQLKSALL